MPKSSKKDKTANFSKAKIKLGKRKQIASNATDTSFKARAIAVPHQTIGQEQTASNPTTRRNLTLDELLIRLKHYNPTTRKDAIWGIRELLDTYPQLIDTSLTPVIQACARVVGDEDAEVRNTLLAFLAWFLRLAPLHKIRPHVPVLILFVTSAQTHIFPTIRMDAVRFIDLLLDLTPELIIEGWSQPQSTGARVLEGYLRILNAGSYFWSGHKDSLPSPSPSSVNLSSNSKYVVLTSISSFIRRAVFSSSSQSKLSSSFWYMASSFKTQAEFLSVCSLIRPHLSSTSDDWINDIEWSNATRQSNIECFVGTFDCAWSSRVSNEFSLGELEEVGQAVELLRRDALSFPQSSSTTSHLAVRINTADIIIQTELTSMQRLAHILHPILTSTWLDVAPSVFLAGTPRDDLNGQLGTSVMEIAGSLYGMILRDVELPIDMRSLAFDDLTTLLRYMSTYLPCISDNRERQFDDVSHHLSFAYCELTSLAVVASQYFPVNAVPRANTSANLKQSKALSIQVDRVGEYVIKALDGELRSVSQPLEYSLTASAYARLLPAIWSLLNHQATVEGSVVSSRIRLACINHARRTPSKSGVKGLATQFIGLLVLLHNQRNGPLEHYTGLTPQEHDQFREWFQELPNVLLEVGVGDLPLTETILRLLLRIAQGRSAPFDATTSGYIRSRLIPYFATVHPEKGMVFGPFTKLKQWPRLRRLALDVIAVLDHDAKTDSSLRTAVENAVNVTEDAQYWFALLHYRKSGP